jgi:hypothetical protein
MLITQYANVPMTFQMELAMEYFDIPRIGTSRPDASGSGHLKLQTFKLLKLVKLFKQTLKEYDPSY